MNDHQMPLAPVPVADDHPTRAELRDRAVRAAGRAAMAACSIAAPPAARAELRDRAERAAERAQDFAERDEDRAQRAKERAEDRADRATLAAAMARPVPVTEGQDK